MKVWNDCVTQMIGRMDTRRDFFKKLGIVGGILALGPRAFAKPLPVKEKTEEVRATVFRVVNGKPNENITKIVEMLGGIENIVGSDDVVVIKPNVQWWNQGGPNISALKTFVDMIMHRAGGFNGEVVIAENCHRGSEPWKSMNSGWAQKFERNSDIAGLDNYNDLCRHLKNKYRDRFSTCHWIRVESGAKRVYGPYHPHPNPLPSRERESFVNGYVYCDGTGGVPLISYDNGLTGENRRTTIMTYPIFTTDKGTIIDFKNGIWRNGAYTEQPLKFINFAASNYHSTFCGATSAIKNYLGVTDLSGGGNPVNNGKLTSEYYNFHSFAFNWSDPGPKPGMLGAEVAVFMNTIRKADLNITTAEWVGMASRTDPPVAHTKVILASKDPVALDYHATKYILFPNSKCRIHNPDDPKSPLNQYLIECCKEGGGIFNEKYVEVKSHDFRTKRLQRDDELAVQGEIDWGWKPRMWGKYIVLRTMY